MALADILGKIEKDTANKIAELEKSFEEKKKKRLLVQYLQRKGFSSDIIYQSVRTLAESGGIENH